MNNSIHKSIRKRNRLHKKAKRSNYPEHWAEFRRARNKTINTIRSQKERYCNKLVDKLKSNSTNIREWWGIASKIAGIKSKDSIIPPLNVHGNVLHSNLEKAEAFNTFFANQSNIDESNKNIPSIDQPPSVCLDHITLHKYEVEDVLRLLNTSKASGPDNISAKLLKVAWDFLSKPLCTILI